MTAANVLPVAALRVLRGAAGRRALQMVFLLGGLLTVAFLCGPQAHADDGPVRQSVTGVEAKKTATVSGSGSGSASTPGSDSPVVDPADSAPAAGRSLAGAAETVGEATRAVDPVAEPVTDAVEPVTEPVARDIVRPAVEPLADVAGPTAKTATRSVADAVEQPVAEAAETPVARTVVRPVAGPVVAEVAPAVDVALPEALDRIAGPVGASVVQPLDRALLRPLGQALVQPLGQRVVEPATGGVGGALRPAGDVVQDVVAGAMGGVAGELALPALPVLPLPEGSQPPHRAGPGDGAATEAAGQRGTDTTGRAFCGADFGGAAGGQRPVVASEQRDGTGDGSGGLPAELPKGPYNSTAWQSAGEGHAPRGGDQHAVTSGDVAGPLFIGGAGQRTGTSPVRDMYRDILEFPG